MNEALYLLAVLLLPLLYILACNYEERRKSRAWRREATLRDYSFREKEKRFEPPHPFPLFHTGALYETRNILEGALDGASLLLAEFTYRVRFGPALFSSHGTCRQTIALLEHPGLDLPRFHLLHRAFTRRVGYEPPGEECDVAGDAAFSAAYTLQAKDPEAVARLFPEAAREYFKRIRDRQIHVSGEGHYLLVHTEDPIDVKELDDFLARVREILALWAAEKLPAGKDA